MEVIRKIIDATSDEITISLPEGYKNRMLEIIVLPYNYQNDHDALLEERFNFSDLSGKLEWSGDAVTEQRKLRNDW